MMSVRDQRLTLVLATALAVPFGWAASAQTLASAEAVAEFPAETAAIVAATTELFDAIEAERAPLGRKAPVIRLPQLATKASSQADAKAGPLTEKGAVRHLTGYRISWYPLDRFLGSVDFMGTWDGNRNLVCGYVTWDLSDPAQPVLDTVSATYLLLDELKTRPETEAQEMLLEANCAYGDIDANYAFFE